jgi:hypothetical protein
MLARERRGRSHVILRGRRYKISRELLGKREAPLPVAPMRMEIVCVRVGLHVCPRRETRKSTKPKATNQLVAPNHFGAEPWARTARTRSRCRHGVSWTLQSSECLRIDMRQRVAACREGDECSSRSRRTSAASDHGPKRMSESVCTPPAARTRAATDPSHTYNDSHPQTHRARLPEAVRSSHRGMRHLGAGQQGVGANIRQ